MGRFKDDFLKISKGIGFKCAVELILKPRLLGRIGWKKCTESKLALRFIKKNFSNVTERYVVVDSIINNSQDIPNVIWVFWWQGLESMPSVIKECYNSILRNANGREVKLLTGDNYQEYVQLPSHILNKFKAEKISYTHFSDIVRVALLSKYGGLWIDAAIFVTKSIEHYEGSFYSPKLSMVPHDSPHLHLWVIGVMGTPPDMPLFLYLYDILTEYWRRYDTEFSYLMFDFFIRYGYEHFSWLRDLIDNRPINSPDLHWSRYRFNQEVDERRLNELIENNTFLSLTYRIHYPMQTENGRDTYYSALLKRYSTFS